MVGFYFKRGLVLAISDLLSIITILLCFVAKIPQIQTLYRMKTSRGLSILALCLQISSYTVMTCYNYVQRYSMLSYLEYPILLIQEITILTLTLKYKRRLDKPTFICAGAYALVTLGFLYNILPAFLLTLMVPLCTPIGATSKIIQLSEIIRTKDATSISLMSWFLSAFTNLTRIYTVSVESGDLMLLLNFGVSFLLSTAVYLAAMYYQKPRYHIKK